MPPETDEQTSEVEELRAQLAQREAELGLVNQEKAALEELVLNGPALAEIARQSNASKGKEVDKMEDQQTTNESKQVVDPKKLAEATVATATKVAQETTDRAIKIAKERETAQNLFDTDPKFKLYIGEIKEIATKHPTLSVRECYNMAVSQNPDKKEPSSKESKPSNREVGRIRDVREETSRGRFSGVPKVRNPEDRQAIHDERFDSAIEAGLKAAGFE